MNPELRQKFITSLQSGGEDAVHSPAAHALITAWLGIETVDKNWEAEGLPGQPSVVDYAAGMVGRLKGAYECRVGSLG